MLALAACSLSAVAGASCSSAREPEEAPSRPDPLDGGVAGETSEPAPDSAPYVPIRDAAPFEGGALPVECTTLPCARALVTTLPSRRLLAGQGELHPTEGFCALLDDGTVACWGANDEGQLGRGEETGVAESSTPSRVIGLSDVVEIAHGCARSDIGDVSCWGPGLHFRDDAGVYTHERAPVKVPIPPAKRIGSGPRGGCAATDDGLLCWGESAYSRMPTRIDLPPGAPIRDVLSVFNSKLEGGATFVLREDGSTLSWGNTLLIARVSSLSPNDPHPAPTALEAVSSIDVTSTSGCATAAGTGYCWGTVDIDGLPVDAAPSPLVHALPEPVLAPEPLVRIATTASTVVDRILMPQRWCAVGASGAVYCWGLNSHGQAGDGTKDHAYHTVKVKGLPAPAAEVKTMPLSTCALLTTGKVYCWGNNFYGQLGSGMVKGGSLTPQEVVLP